MGKICCVTGNRPHKFPWDYNTSILYEVYKIDIHKIVKSLIREGYDHFIAGGAMGVDSDFALCVAFLKLTQKLPITLEIAVPCKNQPEKWDENKKYIYKIILSLADKVTVLSKKYTPTCMQERNRYMVEKSDLVFAFLDTRNHHSGAYATINYAKRLQKEVRMYALEDLHEEDFPGIVRL